MTFSYLISAPMINEVAAILLFGLFGWKIALIYVVSGLVIAIVVGIILGILAIALTKKHERTGVFGKALVGICINGLLFLPIFTV